MREKKGRKEAAFQSPEEATVKTPLTWVELGHSCLSKHDPAWPTHLHKTKGLARVMASVSHASGRERDIDYQ